MIYFLYVLYIQVKKIKCQTSQITCHITHITECFWMGVHQDNLVLILGLPMYPDGPPKANDFLYISKRPGVAPPRSIIDLLGAQWAPLKLLKVTLNHLTFQMSQRHQVWQTFGNHWVQWVHWQSLALPLSPSGALTSLNPYFLLFSRSE